MVLSEMLLSSSCSVGDRNCSRGCCRLRVCGCCPISALGQGLIVVMVVIVVFVPWSQSQRLQSWVFGLVVVDVAVAVVAVAHMTWIGENCIVFWHFEGSARLIILCLLCIMFAFFVCLFILKTFA